VQERNLESKQKTVMAYIRLWKCYEVMITGAFSGAKILVQIDKYWGSWCMHQLHDASNDISGSESESLI